MLPEDCELFLDFVQKRDPVFVLKRHSECSAIKSIPAAWEKQGLYVLWNQTIIPSLVRYEVPRTAGGTDYHIDSDLPVIEFSYPGPIPVEWNNRPALVQGRVWASFQQPTREFESWYNAVIRWIRKVFISNPVLLGGFVGPAAYEWWKCGGLLLPQFKPPITSSWLSWMDAQDQHRAVFDKD